MIFPEAKIMHKTADFSFLCEIKPEASISGEFSENTLKTAFPQLYTEGNLVIECKSDRSLSELSDEAFRIEADLKDNRLHMSVYAFGDRALIRALFSVRRMMLADEFFIGEMTDYPSFAVRGYIEGFYGKPWKSDERYEMLEFMALYGENTHYYAPKDDPYHRDKWNELYPAEQAAALKKLVDKADSLYMDFYYCIAPGLSMCYSSEKDFEALCNKTRQLFSMGISNFGLLLDDIPADLFFEEDKKQFGNAARAHTVIVEKYFSFLRGLDEKCRLTVCPTAYHGKGNERELTDFAANIPSEVDVFYTGSDICSKEITSQEAAVFLENTGHKPLYWDNYPVNDAEMFMEMHMGPITGREGELYKHSAGLISNCMEYFICNKIPLITVAAYLWNSEKYDPEKAYNAAVKAVLPEDEAEDFILLADHFRMSCLHDENSRIMGEYYSLAGMCRHTGDMKRATEILEGFTNALSSAAQRLKQRSYGIYAELSRWIKKFCLMAEISEIALDVIKGADRKQELYDKMEVYNESATVLTSFCFREYIESVLADEN